VNASNIPFRKHTNRIIVHHALAMQCSMADIWRWHKARGFLAPGYHYLFRKDGRIEEGRDLRCVGSHALGRNHDSIGWCYEMDGRYEELTMEQIFASMGRYHCLCRQYNKALKVEFHRPHIFNLFESGTYGRLDACPGKRFDRYDFLEQIEKENPYKKEVGDAEDQV